MREVGARVARRHGGVVEPDGGERRGLERRDIGRPRRPVRCACQAWSSRAAARYSLVAKPSLNAATPCSLSTSSCGMRLAGLEVHGVVGEHLRPQHPHLVDLAGELDEVAEHVRARELRVGHPREEPVQRVPELVEERVDLVVGEQRRLAGGGLRHVEVVGDDDRGARAGSTARRASSSTRRRASSRACRGRAT